MNKYNKMIIDINYEVDSLPNIFFSFKKDSEEKKIMKNEWEELRKIKNTIDDYNLKDWDKSKKMTNPYELIYMPSRKIRSESIANIDPLSRSYFKMWEILFNHVLFTDGTFKKKITIVSIAEGPGGFIEALVTYRKKYNQIVDDVFAMTLRSTHKEIPGWDKAYNFLNENKNVSIHYGVDNTGNIYNKDNILSLKNEIIKNNAEMAHIVTADGGFDYSANFNNQESSSLRIIFAEIVTALTMQKQGGHFICKMFDTYLEKSVYFIYLLCGLYEKVCFHKPVTSRPANSEKYIICKTFKGIPDDYLKKLQIILKCWEHTDENDYKIESIFNSEIPEGFLKQMEKLNTNHFIDQKRSIKETIDIIKNKPNLTDLNRILKNQVKLAINWCKQYEVDVNINSTFLNK